MDPNNVYEIPPESQTPSGQDGIFGIDDLQEEELLNDGSICALLSLFLCFHTTGVKDHLIDPHFCFTQNRTIDFSSLVLLKINNVCNAQSKSFLNPALHRFMEQLW